MGKLVSIETFERFETLWNANKIDLRSLTFILDTGQLYTHGIFLNSVVYGEEASGAVPVTIAGVTKTLALSSHNHDATYYKKTENINLGAYKLVSGEKELIYLNNAKIYVGDTTLPIQIQSNAALKSYRDLHEYTILDTGNFSIEAKTVTGTILSNVATFKYGGTNFLLDYVKRINTSSTFDSLATYTNAGTTLVNNKQYGIATFYTDGTASNSAKWAQLRVDIASKALEIRTSDSTSWVGFPTGSYKNIKVNNTNYALLTSENSLPTIYAPASAGTGFLKGSTDGNGNITWTWDNSTYNNYSLPTATDSLLGGVKVGTTLESATGYTAVHIKDGVIYYKNYTATPILGGSTAISNATSDTSNPYLNIIENGAKSGSIQITGSGGTSVKAKNGILTISSPSLGTGASDAAKGNHDHTLSIATDNGTNEVSLSAGTKYKLTAGGKALIFTTPSDTKYTLTLNGTAKGTTGGTDLGTFYAIATSDSSIANQVWMRNSDNTAYAWRTLGSRAFDSTAYLPLAGGTMTGNISFSGDNNITWSRNTDYAKIHFKNTGDGDSDSYLGFETADNGNEYFRFGHTSGTYTEWMSIKSDGVRVNGTKVSLEGHTHSYLPLSGGTVTGNISMNNSSSITNLPINGGIYWNPYVESATDGTDVASITLINSGPEGGTTLVLTQQNDANDTIQFVTNGSANLYHNSNKIWDAGNDGSGSGLDADTVDGYHASQFLQRLPWWTSGNGNNINNIANGTTFAYTNHNAPTNGVFVAFSGTHDSYQLQLQGQYNGENLYFRNKNGDNGTWNTWRYVIHSGNIGSQSVNYANYSDYATRLDGGAIAGWGTLTANNGYSGIAAYDWGDKGAFCWAGKDGQMYMQVDGYFYQNEGRYLVLDTNNYTSYADSRYVLKTGDTMTGMLGFGNDSAAFRIQTGTNSMNSPLRGTKLPATSSSFIGIFARPGKSTDEGGILLSEDTCVVYNSHDTGWGFLVVDTDLSQSDWSVVGAQAFGVNASHQAWSLGGFVKSNSSDSYVLLGGGGHKALNNLQEPGTASALNALDVTKTFIYATVSSNQTLGVSAAMTVGQVLTVLVYNSGSSSITVTVPTSDSWKSLDGLSINIGALKFGEISILCYAATVYMVSAKTQ